MTRRQFLVGGGVLVAGVAVAAGFVGWRSWTVRDRWYRLTGAYGEPGTPPPASAVTYEHGTLPSPHLAAPAAYDIAYPPGVAGGVHRGEAATPVLICLPGRSRSPGDLLQGHLRFGDYVADGIEKRGVPPFAVAAVQASDTYWHRRTSGDDAMAMLFDEFIPFLRDQRGLTGPLAIMGWSMGAYGALRAAELHPQQFTAVCAVSAALWRSFDAGVGDAFDSAADYAANDVFQGVDGLTACRSGWIAAGRTRSTRRTRRSWSAAGAAGGWVQPRRPQRRLLEPRGAGGDRLDRRAVRGGFSGALDGRLTPAPAGRDPGARA